MCGYGAKFNKPDKFMDYTLFDSILSELNGDFEVLRLNGRGESTIHPSFVKLLRRARACYSDGRFRLFSNMNYQDDEITDALSECACETMISFDSTRKENLEHIRKGTNFQTVMHNIERLCAKSKLTAIVFTLQPDNFYEIWDVARFSFEHNCHFFCNAVRNIWMDEEFSKLVNNHVDYLKDTYIQINKLFAGSEVTSHLPNQIAGVVLGTNASNTTCADFAHCPNVGRDICIYYNGKVTPCGMFNPYVLGDLRNQSMKTIMEGEQLSQFIKRQSTDPYCRNCQYICG